VPKRAFLLPRVNFRKSLRIQDRSILTASGVRSRLRDLEKARNFVREMQSKDGEKVRLQQRSQNPAFQRPLDSLIQMCIIHAYGLQTSEPFFMQAGPVVLVRCTRSPALEVADMAEHGSAGANESLLHRKPPPFMQSSVHIPRKKPLQSPGSYSSSVRVGGHAATNHLWYLSPHPLYILLHLFSRHISSHLSRSLPTNLSMDLSRNLEGCDRSS
jgi:hypothetical protein